MPPGSGRGAAAPRRGRCGSRPGPCLADLNKIVGYPGSAEAQGDCGGCRMTWGAGLPGWRSGLALAGVVAGEPGKLSGG
jgi:hypothetical protein